MSASSARTGAGYDVRRYRVESSDIGQRRRPSKVAGIGGVTALNDEDPGLSGRAIMSILVVVAIVIVITVIAGGQAGEILNTSSGNV